jgi:hypothetical protein
MLSQKRALKQYIERHIREGFMQRDDIVQATILEFRSEFGGTDFYQAVATTVDRYLARYLIMESRWVTATDCDKLDKAFCELERLGIIARQHFACCNDCGHKEMQSEIRRMRGRSMTKSVKGSQKLIGFAFFHQQDTERAVKNGTLFVTFDVLEKNDARAAEVGAMIVEALKRAGLVTTWNGSYLQRIAVTNLSWRKRRFSSLTVRNTG